MAEIRPIALSDLMFDNANPRLASTNTDQRASLQAIAEHQNVRLLALAAHIQENGLNPAEMPIVMPRPNDPNRFIVLEGNRRLAALKLLENPQRVTDVFHGKNLRDLKELSKSFQSDPITEVTCTVVDRAEDAEKWIELRHTGQHNGAGLVPWQAAETARFRARRGNLAIHYQALNFLEEEGLLDAKTRDRVPASSIQRLLGTPEFRKWGGLDWKDGELIVPDRKKSGKALIYVIRLFTEGDSKLKVEDIYTRPKRIEFTKKLPAELSAEVTPTASGTAAGSSSARKVVRPRRFKQDRDKLIPPSCILSITDERLSVIERELRTLSLEHYRNAISVLFRVFIELSLDHYSERHSTGIDEDEVLGKKMIIVAEHLRGRQLLSNQQFAPVKKACNPKSWLAPGIMLFHAYVHNRHIFPSPSDLRSAWDDLQPFMMGIWKP